MYHPWCQRYTSFQEHFGPVASVYIRISASLRQLEVDTSSVHQWKWSCVINGNHIKTWDVEGPQFRILWDDARNTTPRNFFCVFILEDRYPSTISDRNMVHLQGLCLQPTYGDNSEYGRVSFIDVTGNESEPCSLTSSRTLKIIILVSITTQLPPYTHSKS